jgi:hypothetical protein
VAAACAYLRPLAHIKTDKRIAYTINFHNFTNKSKKTNIMNKYGMWEQKVNCEIPNKENPFDEAGLQHNHLMAIIEEKGNPKMSLDEVYELCDSVLYEKYKDELIPNYSSNKFATPIVNLESQREYENFINSLDIDNQQKNYLFELFDIMFKYDVKNLCDIIDEIKLFESNLLKNHKPEDLKNVLITSSVGRYSLAYWDDRYDQGDITAKAFWKKFFTGVADAVGATAGAIAGSATVVGGIAGGIVGAIGASSGFASVWDVFAN